MASPSGRFAVGIADLVYSDPDDHSTDALNVDPKRHLVGALFYPSDDTVTKRGLDRARWVAEYGYARGFAKFIGLASSSNPVLRVFWPLLGSLMAAFTYLLGHFHKLSAYKGLPISSVGAPHPIVVLSHGVGGNRMVQSCICCELASQGFCVLSLEHADGSASAVHLAGSYQPQWLYFQVPEEPGAAAKRTRRIVHRLEEMRTAARLLSALTEGRPVAGLSFPNAAKGFASSLKDKLDTSCAATIGHSFGAGPSCALPLEDTGTFKCGIGMDPYWPALPESHAVFARAQTASPIMMIGCQSWNDPDEKSYLKSDLEKESLVMAAASRENGGGGSISLVLRGIGHASFTDAELLFGNTSPGILRGLPKNPLKAKTAISLLKEIVLAFLSEHLPLSHEQRRLINPQAPRLKTNDDVRQDTANKSGPFCEESQVGAASSEVLLASPSRAGDGRRGVDTGGLENGSNGKRSRVGKPVTEEEEAFYKGIVGESTVYSLKLKV